MTGESEGPAQIPGNAIADDAGGISAALSIMIALIHKQRTGEGQHVRVSMLDATIALLWPEGMAAHTFLSDEKRLSRPSRSVTDGRLELLDDQRAAYETPARDEADRVLRTDAVDDIDKLTAEAHTAIFGPESGRPDNS